MPSSEMQTAFLFMPDISGFTRFIGETEVQHSTHIIKELLELIIRENELNMELLEIEGDAIFFYRLHSIPTVDDIIGQAKRIFTKFHQHLLKYEQGRICQCGACRTANNLTLKFIIHQGMVSHYTVNKQFKLIGNEVILLHRLLKNAISENEYLLFTQPFFQDVEKVNTKGSELNFRQCEEVFDGAGISYQYAAIRGWLNDISSVGDDRPEHELAFAPVVTISKNIPAAAEKVFSYLANLSKRIEWMAGVQSVEVTNEKTINQEGTIHQCLVENVGKVIFKTANTLPKKHSFCFDEISAGQTEFGHRYVVEKIDTGNSKVQMQFLLKKNFMQIFLFGLFKRQKVTRQMRQSLENVYAMCRQGQTGEF